MRKLKTILGSMAVMTALAAGAQAQDCPGNLVSNGDFTAGFVGGSMPSPGAVADWSMLTNSPQVVNDGCAADFGSVQMWGNSVVGESIKQALPGLGIEAGKIYSVTVCYRWLDNNPILPPRPTLRPRPTT